MMRAPWRQDRAPAAAPASVHAGTNLALRAARLLPHPFRLQGPVVHGMSRGRTLGFPTANIRPDKSLLPAYGVYAVQVHLGTQAYPGVANIGDNPTFGDEGVSLEVFIFDFQGDIYGSELMVEFIERLRDEIRFENKGQLIAQIEKDCRDARTILGMRARS